MYMRMHVFSYSAVEGIEFLKMQAKDVVMPHFYIQHFYYYCYCS